MPTTRRQFLKNSAATVALAAAAPLIAKIAAPKVEPDGVGEAIEYDYEREAIIITLFARKNGKIHILNTREILAVQAIKGYVPRSYFRAWSADTET